MVDKVKAAQQAYMDAMRQQHEELMSNEADQPDSPETLPPTA